MANSYELTVLPTLYFFLILYTSFYQFHIFNNVAFATMQPTEELDKTLQDKKMINLSYHKENKATIHYTDNIILQITKRRNKINRI